MKAQLYILEGL